MKTVHPFPARMAPGIVKATLSKMKPGETVLDPMCGSGTVLRAASEFGLNGIGFDIDPLAELMSRVWTTRVNPQAVVEHAWELVRAAKSAPAIAEGLDERDAETKSFIEYWFAPNQREHLTRLAVALRQTDVETRDVLAISLSRIIVTKGRGASLARDTSHSRPHKVATDNNFDVYSGFLAAVRTVIARLNPSAIRGDIVVARGDARHLTLDADEVDLVITSPPYLNAIDYLRGHRLALVWLGYNVSTIRSIRAASIGAERMLNDRVDIDVDPYILEGPAARLTSRHRGWTRRFGRDMLDVMRELQRVVRTGGKIVMVVGNSLLRGAEIDNAGVVEEAAAKAGLVKSGRRQRTIPARRRYLPPPTDKGGTLDVRMRTEVILEFEVA